MDLKTDGRLNKPFSQFGGNLKTEKSPFDLEFGRSLAQENIFGGLGRVWIYIAKDEFKWVADSFEKFELRVDSLRYQQDWGKDYFTAKAYVMTTKKVVEDLVSSSEVKYSMYFSELIH